jgi:hypothetical protein
MDKKKKHHAAKLLKNLKIGASIYVCVYIYIYTHTYAYVHIVHIHTYIHTHSHTHTHTHTHKTKFQLTRPSLTKSITNMCVHTHTCTRSHEIHAAKHSHSGKSIFPSYLMSFLEIIVVAWALSRVIVQFRFSNRNVCAFFFLFMTLTLFECEKLDSLR